MKVRVGLTGGVGAGKSEVARILESLGAFIIDTDPLARQAVAPDSDALRAIARVWQGVVRNGMLDRTALSEIVFSDPAAREKLNAIVHPFIRQLARDRERYAGKNQIVVHVVPLLFETGYGNLCGVSLLVVAPERERISRVMRRNRWTEAQARARMAAQIDPEVARTRATYVIENNADLASLHEETARVYRVLESSVPGTLRA
ncbi:MAG: dephospho-CoA kinase [Candidatus Eremiobacteraeota bacterium]|nr:dephospho-CoA kinase [Candidatus Eremiobacteraeota bacterium]